MKKRLSGMFLSAITVLSLAACGTQTGSDAPLGSSETPASETSQTDEEALTCTLNVWSPSEDQDPEYGEWLITMCNQFNELHPNWDITFNYGVCSETDTRKLLLQDIDAAADVFIFSSTGLENLCQANCLSQFGGKYLNTLQTNYPEVLTECLTYEDGGIYGVPATTNTFFMYYDKSVFTEEDVKSLETMLQKGKVAIPITDGFYLSSFYLGAGCEFFGPEGKNREAGIKMDGDNAVAMTNYLVDLVQNENMVAAIASDAISMMREGKVDAYFCGTWQAAQTKEILGENFGVAPLPSVLLDGVETPLRPFSSAKAIGVKSTTQIPQVAIELAMYLGGYEGQKAHYEMRNYVPCQNTLLTESEIMADEVVMTDANTIANIAVPRSNFTEMSYFWTPAESFGIELRDGLITHGNAAEKTAAFHASVNSSGVK